VWVWAPGDERALLGILEWTGLRKEAVASLRICDVWSDESNDVRDVVTAIEKFSRRHSLSMPAPLREVLRLYLTGPESPRLAQTLDPLLFPHHRGVFNRPSPSFVATKRLLEKGRREREEGRGRGRCWRSSKSLVATTLRRLCRRAGIHPPFHPHQFRAYLVDRMLTKGRTLAEAACLLGHRSTTVTFRHYWKTSNTTATHRNVWIPMLDERERGEEEGGEEASSLSSSSSSSCGTNTLDEWEATQQQRMELQRDLDAIVRA
jgi:integrase